MIELMGKLVEVSTGDTVYIGTLVEVNEDEVYLQTASGWVTVPMNMIASISGVEED